MNTNRTMIDANSINQKMKSFSIRIPDDLEAALAEWSRQQKRSRNDLIKMLLERSIRSAIETGEYKPANMEPSDIDVSIQRVLDYLFRQGDCRAPDNIDIFRFAESRGYPVGDVAKLIEERKEQCCEASQ